MRSPRGSVTQFSDGLEALGGIVAPALFLAAWAGEPFLLPDGSRSLSPPALCPRRRARRDGRQPPRALAGRCIQRRAHARARARPARRSRRGRANSSAAEARDDELVERPLCVVAGLELADEIGAGEEREKRHDRMVGDGLAQLDNGAAPSSARSRPDGHVSRRSARAGDVDPASPRQLNGRDERDRAPADALGLLEAEEVAEAGSVQLGPAASVGDVRRRRLEVSDRGRVASHEPVDREAIGRDGDTASGGRPSALGVGSSLTPERTPSPPRARGSASSSSAASLSLPGIRWP